MKKLEVKLHIKEAIPKINESPSDCQDAIAANSQTGRFAVADGVARSFFPAEWSRLLVEQFCFDTSNLNLALLKTRNWQDWLTPIQDKWSISIQEKVSKKTGMASVHLKNSLLSNEPAASTFTGIQIQSNGQGNFDWQGMVIGDSCLFHFRDNKINSYLVKSSLDFNYHPEYFSSVPLGKKHQPTFISGTFESGDVFLLATDALAKWIFNQYERGGTTWSKTWESLVNLRNWKDLYTFVTKARENVETPMDDDDVALIILSCVEVKSSQNIEIFEKPKQKNEPFIVPSQKLPTPVPQVTNPTTRIPTAPVQATRTESDNTPNRQTRKASGVAVFAIIFSLVSLLISAIGFYRISRYINQTPPTPIIIVPTRTKIPFLTDTPIPTVSPTITLPVNALVYLNPDSQSQTIFTTQGELPVLVIENKDNWLKIQSDVWILVTNTEPASLIIQGDLTMTQNPTPVYLSPSIAPIPTGTLTQGVIAQKINEQVDTNGTWYQVRLTGFVLGN